MSVVSKLSQSGHEQLRVFQNKKLGHTFLIAVHDTRLGPALGGCRYKDYTSLEEALADVLALSEAMTYKNSLAGINFGGGKSVIYRHEPKKTFERKEIFREFGRLVASASGSYITAEDMGTNVADLDSVLQECPYVSGKNPESGGGGDPSPWTALGVFSGARACLEKAFGSPSFVGRSFSVLGVGNVGYALCSLLAEAGAKLRAADIDEKAAERARRDFGAEVVGVEEILGQACDVFSPCAVGGVINSANVDLLNCKIVCGAANNQLENPEIEAKLSAAGIVYAPDFAVNAGGVILCADEFEEGGFSPARVTSRAENIYSTISQILKSSDESGKLPGEVAQELALARVTSMGS